MVGNVYIASMNMRGKWAEPLTESVTLNVTSAQAKNSKNRLDFSPMTPVVGGYKGYLNFEHYWQSGKVYDNIDSSITKQWWKDQTTPKRRYPNSKNKKVLYTVFENGEKMDYITSRKQVYVPEYYNLIKEREMVKKWQEILKTQDITVYDFDGPRTADGNVICIKITRETLIEKINDTNYPFGHGYIVAGLIAGITPDAYI